MTGPVNPGHNQTRPLGRWAGQLTPAGIIPRGDIFNKYASDTPGVEQHLPRPELQRNTHTEDDVPAEHSLPRPELGRNTHTEDYVPRNIVFRARNSDGTPTRKIMFRPARQGDIRGHLFCFRETSVTDVGIPTDVLQYIRGGVLRCR